ncbi:MAG: hypothetical protein HQ567_11080 [Candidatus Nealsonbacteria bacterium]|nr:hypothetical protein [Candidatus Nealsonbacteria bacterium]
MRQFAILALAGTSIALATAYGQNSGFQGTPVAPTGGTTYVGGGYGGGYHASTAAEGQLRGMGDLVRSKGEANLSNSAAAINYTVAQSNAIQNKAAYTETYFEMRRANKAYRAAEKGPKPTMEQLVRLAQDGAPKRLSPSELDTVTGSVNWPRALQADSFANQRTSLEAAFARRGTNSVIGTKDYTLVRNETTAMLADLKKQVRDMPPQEYSNARKFLESLAYEATQPAG